MSVLDPIGRYTLRDRLGSGGFAVVWRAYDTSLDADVAIKVMAENWADRLDLRERFLAEARMLRHASSGRVVQVFDVGELPDGRPYFVMEFADRGTLADRLGDGPLPLPDALRLTAEVARGVAELHLAGIVHRDLKPSNVLIKSAPDGSERLLVADLGVAKNLAYASALTMSVGSAGYMAPEQSGPNTDVDVRADVYGLGALAYRVITGQVPGPPGGVLPPRSLRPELPADVATLLTQALAPRREDRWPSAASFAERLDALADRTEAGEPGVPRRRRTGMVLLVLLVVLLLATATVATLLWNARPVTVADATGRLTARVPRAWSAGRVTGGWDEAAIGLPSGHQPALLASTDLAQWGDLRANVNGVFAGVVSGASATAGSRAADAVARISHPGCQDGGERPYTDARWRGQMRVWDRCGGSDRSITEITVAPAGSPDLEGVYVQIRQSTAGPAASRTTTTILSGIRLTR